MSDRHDNQCHPKLLLKLKFCHTVTLETNPVRAILRRKLALTGWPSHAVLRHKLLAIAMQCMNGVVSAAPHLPALRLRLTWRRHGG